ncbi:hypothetical protein [Streptomyces sp. R41]|uniref:Uncharacterized protein n=1 Tax=Streptomyces sp. R41 TaxID=3238632 RepID=A0AB39RPB4_9ACTN
MPRPADSRRPATAASHGAPRPPQPVRAGPPLDGTATVAVRPYVTAHEQRERRRELALATLGPGMPGPYWIHGLEVA